MIVERDGVENTGERVDVNSHVDGRGRVGKGESWKLEMVRVESVVSAVSVESVVSV